MPQHGHPIRTGHPEVAAEMRHPRRVLPAHTNQINQLKPLEVVFPSRNDLLHHQPSPEPLADVLRITHPFGVEIQHSTVSVVEAPLVHPFKSWRFVLPQIAQDPANVKTLLASPRRVIVAAEQQALRPQPNGVSYSFLL
jgi:hypothetical protein